MDHQIDKLRPKGKRLKSLSALTIVPGKTVVTAKCDGEFTLIKYFKDRPIWATNRWNTSRLDLDALNDLKVKLDDQPVLTRAELLAELYAVDGEKMLRLPQFIHIIKSHDSQLIKKHIRLAIFDFTSTDGHPVDSDYSWRIDELESWIGGIDPEPYCWVVPHIMPKDFSEIEEFWKLWVEQGSYEGIMAWTPNEFYKYKTERDVDAVVIGINKNQSYSKQEAGSLRIALMNEDGSFIELGDVGSGIGPDLRKALWKLIQLRCGEDDKTLWVKPIVIAKITYDDTYPATRPILEFNGKTWKHRGNDDFVSLRHPRLIEFRPDKKVCYKDLRREQI